MKKYKLDLYEQELENNFEKMVTPKDNAKLQIKLQSAAKRHVKEKNYLFD